MKQEDQKAFLGTGWAFPVCLDEEGRIDTVAYEEDIDQAIKIILGTDRGERVMRPDFGAGLNSFMFEPLNSATIHLVKKRVEESLIDWEPRINLQSVKVTSAYANNAGKLAEESKTSPLIDRNVLLIDVTYKVRATNSVRNLVYPFYLQEGASR